LLKLRLVAAAETSKLGDVPLTPAQHATLRRHVERVQTTLRPHSKQRADVRHLFQRHEPSDHKASLKSEDQTHRQHKDVADVNMFVSMIEQLYSFVVHRCKQ